MNAVSQRQSIDTGMAMTLIFMIVSFFTNFSVAAFGAAFICLLITMTVPVLMKPVAVLWFGFSGLLGGFMSSLILSLIFFVIVVPMGWLSQKLGKDSLKTGDFSANSTAADSAFNHRQHTFEKQDLLHPY